MKRRKTRFASVLPPLTDEQRVRRRYPKATLLQEYSGYTVLTNNGSGNAIGWGETEEQAWHVASQGLQT